MFELPSIDLSLSRLTDLDLVFVFAEDYEKLFSTLKNGVPFEYVLFAIILGFTFPLPFILNSLVKWKSGIFLLTMFYATSISSFFNVFLVEYIKG